MVIILQATSGHNKTNFRFPCGPQDCAEALCWKDRRRWPLLNHPRSEPIYPSAHQSEDVQIVCGRRGWTTLLLRRQAYNPSVNFTRSWREYENGFGMRGNHWLGLKHLHRLSSRGRNTLRVSILDSRDNWHFYQYDGFWVDSASNFYTLYLGPKLNPRDMFKSARGRPFTTPDKNSTDNERACSARFKSGWWFSDCTHRLSRMINLNGRQGATDDTRMFAKRYTVKECSLVMRPYMFGESQRVCDKSCPNGGTCKQTTGKMSYFCRCPPGYTGWRCEFPVSETINSKGRDPWITRAPVDRGTTEDGASQSHFFNADFFVVVIIIMLLSTLVLIILHAIVQLTIKKKSPTRKKVKKTRILQPEQESVKCRKHRDKTSVIE